MSGPEVYAGEAGRIKAVELILEGKAKNIQRGRSRDRAPRRGGERPPRVARGRAAGRSGRDRDPGDRRCQAPAGGSGGHLRDGPPPRPGCPPAPPVRRHGELSQDRQVHRTGERRGRTGWAPARLRSGGLLQGTPGGEGRQRLHPCDRGHPHLLRQRHAGGRRARQIARRQEPADHRRHPELRVRVSASAASRSC